MAHINLDSFQMMRSKLHRTLSNAQFLKLKQLAKDNVGTEDTIIIFQLKQTLDLYHNIDAQIDEIERMIELLSDLEISKFQGNYWQLIKQIAKLDLLIIDDFLLSSTTPHEQQDLMEVMEKRSRDRSPSYAHRWILKNGIVVWGAVLSQILY